MKGWYFGTQDKKLRYGDGREIVIGESHEVAGPIELCWFGLHASKNILDALEYAPGPMLYRVELYGNILHGDNKSCATGRRYLAGVDATEMLRQFARECALSVAHLWNMPDVVRDFLMTGDDSLRDAAWAAARAAARDAARAAAWDAAWAAARAAARAAERAAARAAAWGAARAAQNDRLTQYANDLMGE